MHVNELIMGALGVIFSFGTIFGIVFYFFHTRSKERMALIEKGGDASLLYTKSSPNKYSALKWALVLIGLALGLFFASLVEHYTHLEEAAQFAMVLLFGGLGLVLYYIIIKGKPND